MMGWIEGTLIVFVFIESVIISVYRLLVKLNPSVATLVILGSKVIKVLLTIGWILFVKYTTEVSIKKFALITVAIYLVSTVVETICLLKMRKNDEKE